MGLEGCSSNGGGTGYSINDHAVDGKAEGRQKDISNNHGKIHIKEAKIQVTVYDNQHRYAE